MPNGRFVSKSISCNEQLATVSLRADFFFQRCIPHLDVEGRITGNPQLLKAAVFPLRDEITAENIPELIAELGQAIDLTSRSLVIWYQVGTQRVLLFPRFREHQTGMKKEREAASRLPELTDAATILSGTHGSDPPPSSGAASIDNDEVRTDSGATPDEVRQKVSEVQVQGEVEVQDQVQGDAVDLEHPTARHADDATGAPDGSATASPAAQDSKTANGPGQTPLGTEARRFLYECYGLRRGVPMTPRQKQVRADLHATLGARGALLERGVYVRAFTAQHLDDACSHVLGQKVKNPDAAIRLVLQFLQKTWQERKAAAEKALRGDESRRAGPPTGPTMMTSILTSAFTDIEHADAAAWFAEQSPEFRAEIERQVASTGVPSGRAPMIYERMLKSAIAVAWRKHGTAELTRGVA